MQWRKPPSSLEHIPSLAADGLFGRYLRDREFAEKLYGAHFSDKDGLKRRAERASARAYPRAELARIVRDQNAGWGMSRATESLIARIERGALCVVTGQQTGLFTGPLYTIYKALTTVRWARYLEEALGGPIVPVFWLAADDHDLAEINHAVVEDREGNPFPIRHESSVEGSPQRVSRLILGEDIALTVSAALAAMPDGPGRDGALEAIRTAYCPGRSWADAFARLLSRWLGSFGLVLVSPDDARLKRLMSRMFLEEIEHPETSLRAVKEGNEVIRRAGYRPQVQLAATGTLVFLDDDTGARRRVDLDRDGYRLAGSETRLGRAEMRQLFEDEPDRFSANALLRPVTADAVLPTLAQVMGPAEVAYMAQARGLYERHGVEMPVLIPRARFTIIHPEIERLLAEKSLALEDAFQPVDRWIGVIAARETHQQFGDAIATCRSDLDAAHERLERQVGNTLPGIANAVTSARMKTQGLMNKLERKIEQEMRRRVRLREENLKRVSSALYPLNGLQERIYAALPFLIRHGTGWFEAMYEAIEVGSADHCAVWPEG